MKPRSNKEVNDNYDYFWKEIVENPNGSINFAQLKKELMDYTDMIHRMSTLTCEVTRNRLSYPTYSVKTILGVMNEVKEDELAEQMQEDQIDGFCSLCAREFD